MSRVSARRVAVVLGPARFASKSHQPLPAGRSDGGDLDRDAQGVAGGDRRHARRRGGRVEARDVAVSPGQGVFAWNVPLLKDLRASDWVADVEAGDEAPPEVGVSRAGSRIQPHDREASVAREQVGDGLSFSSVAVEVDDQAVRVHRAGHVHRVELDVQLPVARAVSGPSGSVSTKCASRTLVMSPTGTASSCRRGSRRTPRGPRPDRSLPIPDHPAVLPRQAGLPGLGSLGARRSVVAVVITGEAGDRCAEQEHHQTTTGASECLARIRRPSLAHNGEQRDDSAREPPSTYLSTGRRSACFVPNRGQFTTKRRQDEKQNAANSSSVSRLPPREMWTAKCACGRRSANGTSTRKSRNTFPVTRDPLCAPTGRHGL